MRDSLIFRITRFSQTRAAAIFIVTGIITVVLGYFALRIRIVPDVQAMMPAKIRQAMEEQSGGQMVSAEYIVLAAESAAPFDLGRLQLLAEVTEAIGAMPGVHSSVTPFTFISFERDGRRVGPVTLGPSGHAPATEEELAVFLQRISTDPLARGMVIDKDGTTLCSFFVVETAENYREFLGAVRAEVSRLAPSYRTSLAGSPTLILAAQQYLERDVPKLLAGTMIVVLAVFFFGFGSKRSFLLPFAVVGIACLWTIGMMSLLGFDLSIVSLMVPPLVLILGSSYSIHIITQYYRDAEPGSPRAEWIPLAIRRIVQTVFLASGTTVFGFLGLLTANIRQIREFGISAAIGIALSALLAFLLLPAILGRLHAPDRRVGERVTTGHAARAMVIIGRLVLRWRWAILATLVLVTVGFALTFHRVRYATDYMSYFRVHEPAVEENRSVIRKLGGYISLNMSLSAPGGSAGYFLDPEVLRRVASLEDRLLENPDVTYISSFVAYLRAYNRALDGSFTIPESRAAILAFARMFRAASTAEVARALQGELVAGDYSRITLVVRVYDSRRGNLMYEDRLAGFAEELRAIAVDGVGAELEPTVWGLTMSAVEVSRQLARDQISTTLIAAALIFGLTSISFRSFRYALYTLIPTATGIFLNFLIMVLFSIPLDLVTVMFSSVALGVGVDSSIHVVIRYRHELKAGGEPVRIIQETLRSAGRPIIHTVVSLVAGLAVLFASSFVPIAYFGLLVSMAILTTSGAALVVLPAILATELVVARRPKKRRAVES